MSFTETIFIDEFLLSYIASSNLEIGEEYDI